MKNAFIKLFKELIHSGMEYFGRYYSIYRAFVVDNDDPSNLCRLKLMIPEISMNAYNYWALSRNTFSGNGYGAQSIPQIGDVVWVEFEKGHPESPIWSLGHRGKNEIDFKKYPDNKDPNTYWFLSPKGNLVIINDTKNEISINHNLGHAIKVNKLGISVISGNKKISLGKENESTHAAVLGDLLRETIILLKDSHQILITAITADIAASDLAGSLFMFKAAQSAAIANIESKIAQFEVKVETILSTTVTLE